jgi:hypothetical protein
MAWAVQYYDGDGDYPNTDTEGGYDTGWRWVTHDEDRDGDSDSQSILGGPGSVGLGAQSGIGGPLREDPSGPNVQLNPGDRLIYRALFTSYDPQGDFLNRGGGAARLLSMAALVDVTVTVIVDPQILVWEERID